MIRIPKQYLIFLLVLLAGFIISYKILFDTLKTMDNNLVKNVGVAESALSDKLSYAVVDIGSNGIRLSITNNLSRALIYDSEERLPISLFDAQHPFEVNSDDEDDDSLEPKPIPDSIMNLVIDNLLLFQAKLKVIESKRVKVEVLMVATESLRTAPNSIEFRERIKERTGWVVRLLSKKDESEITSYGVMASFNQVNGLVMDLGGGSLELNFVTAHESGLKPMFSIEPQSLPFGAAKLDRWLSTMDPKESKNQLKKEILTSATNLNVKSKDVKIFYWSGGGFRAIGYSVMHFTNHPIRIINGYTCTIQQLLDTLDSIEKLSAKNLEDEDIFRVSKKRLKVLPAIVKLIHSLVKVFEGVESISFSGGGVRHGLLYQKLTDEVKAIDPLLDGLVRFIEDQPHFDNEEQDVLFGLIKPIVEHPVKNSHYVIPDRLVKATVMTSQLFTHLTKESQSQAGLDLFTRGGALASLPGLSHIDRAILGIALNHRFGNTILESDINPIKSVLTKPQAQAAQSLGQILAVLSFIAQQQDLNLKSLIHQVKIQSNQDLSGDGFILSLPKGSLLKSSPILNKLISKCNKKHDILTVSYSL